MVVKQLAAHIGTNDRRRRLYLLSIATRDLDAFERAVLDELDERVGTELGTGKGLDLCDSRRAAAQALAEDAEVAERIAHAPRSYVLANEPEELVRQARLAEPPPRQGSVRVAVSGDTVAHRWQVDVASRDHHGLLAVIARTFSDAGMDIKNASIAAWGDGVVVDSFLVSCPKRPSAKDLSLTIEQGLREPVRPKEVPGASVRFDNASLPWFTACVVEADDAPGVLAGISAAFALADVEVHSARLSVENGVVVDRFALSDRSGRKLDAAAQSRVRRALEGLSVRGRRASS
jgi:UTP:GlnB (protein PII) uridylyltransferase